MRIMAASDLHGSAHYGRLVLEAFRREGADRLLLLGDLLYHGPRNPLPEGHAPMELAALLNGAKDRIFAVRGNCDAEIDQMVLGFPMMADYCLLPWRSRMIFITHGHLFHKDALPPLQPGDLLLQGHTHVPSWERQGNGVWVMNPGSAALPKEDSPRGYLMLEEDVIVWKTLDGTEYHRWIPEK